MVSSEGKRLSEVDFGKFFIRILVLDSIVQTLGKVAEYGVGTCPFVVNLVSDRIEGWSSFIGNAFA